MHYENCFVNPAFSAQAYQSRQPVMRLPGLQRPVQSDAVCFSGRGGLTVRQKAEAAAIAADMQKQLAAITPNDIAKLPNRYKSPQEKALALQLLQRMAQFGNYQSLNILYDKVKPDLIAYGLATMGGSMFYLKENKSMFFGPTLTQPLTPQELKKQRIYSGTLILDEPLLVELERSQELRDYVSSHSGIKLAYPAGWIGGINPFTQGDLPRIGSRMNQLFRVVEQNQDEFNLDLQASIDAALIEPVQNRLKQIGLDDRLIVLKNEAALAYPASADAIAQQLAPLAQITPEVIEKKIAALPPAYRDLALAALRETYVMSERTMVLEAQKLHRKIIRKAFYDGISQDNIYFYIPYTGKSYGFMTMLYCLANNISPSQIIRTHVTYEKHYGQNNFHPDDLDVLSRFKPRTMVVALDDIAAIGDSIKAGRGVREVYEGPIVLATLLSSSSAKKLVDGELEDDHDAMFLFNTLIHPVEKSRPIKDLKLDPKETYKFYQLMNWLDEEGKMPRVPSHNYQVVFPYMAPDNNAPYFHYQFAPLFTLNGQGLSCVTGGDCETEDWISPEQYKARKKP